MTISRRIFFKMKSVLDKVVEKIKIHILCQITFSENRAVYEIMSKNMVEPEKPQMAIWRPLACWIIKATRGQAHASARASTSTRTYIHPRAWTHTRARAQTFRIM